MTKNALLVYYTNFYNYQKMGLYNLPFFKEDAVAIGTLLQRKGWNNDYLDDLGTKANIIQILNQLASNSTDDGLILFYFIGHGIKVEEFYFVTYTKIFTNPNNIPFSELLSAKELGTIVSQFLKDKPNRIFITITDACFSGLISNAIPSSVTNHWLIASSLGSQFSVVDKATNNTFFFNALITAEEKNTSVMNFINDINKTMETADNTPIVEISNKYNNIINPI